MNLQRVHLLPLRLWLQSTSLLAVIAGYGVLLLFNQGLAGIRREATHRELLAQVTAAVQGRVSSQSQFTAWEANALMPGLQLERLPEHSRTNNDGRISPGRKDNPIVEHNGREAWLVSDIAFPLVDGSLIQLRIRQNITPSVEQEKLTFWWLVVAAGLSVLFTSALLRLVLRRGLVHPLENFTSQLQTIQAPPIAGDVMDVQAQPEELQPIAIAFNQLQQRLLNSWERQRSFVDGVAHELRTPITLISGHTQSLLRHQPQQSTATLKLIQEEAERMGSLVSDLLDLARRDSGRLELKCQLIIGDDALLELYERMAPKAANRLRIDTTSDGEGPLAQGFGDPDRLQQCLTTLVDNALLYSPDGSEVILSCTSSQDADLILHVRDHGPGVQAEERERIFERFVRGSAGLASKVRGSGIGLSVAKLLMEAMGGCLVVVIPDDGGGGTDFQLQLPGVNP